MKITIIALAAGAAALAGCANVHDTPLASVPVGTQGASSSSRPLSQTLLEPRI